MGGDIYRIGSFNMYQLNYVSTDESRKDFELLARIISGKTDHRIAKNFDIIAIQEAVSEDTVNHLVDVLNKIDGAGNSKNKKWVYRWAQPRYLAKKDKQGRYLSQIENIGRAKGFSNSKREAEGYAFIWNSERFMLSWSYPKGKEGNKRICEPRIYNQYRIDYSSGQKPLARNPYYGRFRPKGREGIELRLINTHITFGTAGSANARRQEFKVLADYIYPKIHNDRISESEPNLTTYTIMLGDYNLNLKRDYTKKDYLCLPNSSKISMEIYTISDQLFSHYSSASSNAVREIKTVQESLSTLKQPNRPNFDGTEGMANNYDHFSYNARYSSDGICQKATTVDTVEDVKKYYSKKEKREIEGQEAYALHKKHVSDHVPIVLKMNF